MDDNPLKDNATFCAEHNKTVDATNFFQIVKYCFYEILIIV